MKMIAKNKITTKNQQQSQSPLVSVVITTKNEETNIENCLKSIKQQSYKNIEIIVVDNNSTDKTKDIAKRYTKLVFNLQDEISLKNIKNFRGAQLNFGVKKSKGEIIFFPDADMTFDKELIKDCVDKLNEVDALFIPEAVCGKGFFGKVRNFERSFYNENCIDGVRVIKKNCFMKVGGYDIKNIVFGFDDWDFTKTLKKNNMKIEISEKKLYHHEELLNLKVYLEKKKKYVADSDSYINKWGREDPDIKKQFGFYYRFFGVFIENKKWVKLLTHPILTLGMYYLRIKVGVGFLTRRRR